MNQHERDLYGEALSALVQAQTFGWAEVDPLSDQVRHLFDQLGADPTDMRADDYVEERLIGRLSQLLAQTAIAGQSQTQITEKSSAVIEQVNRSPTSQSIANRTPPIAAPSSLSELFRALDKRNVVAEESRGRDPRRLAEKALGQLNEREAIERERLQREVDQRAANKDDLISPDHRGRSRFQDRTTDENPASPFLTPFSKLPKTEDS